MKDLDADEAGACARRMTFAADYLADPSIPVKSAIKVKQVDMTIDDMSDYGR